ncbi:Uncharacterised protein [Chlamydia trachomatis]|nr:Uncharacterised protein [Chlamydia trachomatis]
MPIVKNTLLTLYKKRAPATELKWFSLNTTWPFPGE